MYHLSMYAIQPLEGRRILRGVRVSTPHQVENWSIIAQERDFDEVLRAWGATIIPFNEQQVSGRDLAKRKVFLEQMERLKRGEADGIAYYDVKRLTRNEFGIDGGIIAKQLVELRAVLVTFRKVYELWRETDLKDFTFECMLAGIDVRGIRDTFWRGLFARAESEPFQMGKAPVGYRNRREVFVKSNGREKIQTFLEKDPDAEEVMREVVRLMDECHSLGEVCRQLNQVSRFLLRARGEQRGERIVPWKPNNLLRMLKNPKYHGQWYFGQNSKRTSPVWEGREDKRFHHDAPELAYWTAADALRWRKKFKPTGAWVPQSRARKYQRGLIGVLACVTCGRPMVSAGALGYQCSSQRNGLCPAAQVLGELPALKALRAILPDLLPSADELAAENARQASSNTLIADLEAKLAMLEEQQKDDTAEWMRIRGAKPAAITQALQDREQEIEATRARLSDARIELAASDGSFINAQELLEHSQEKIDTLTPYQQAMVYRLLVADVRIKGEGIARGRRWTVLPGYRALLKESTLSDPIAAHWYANLAMAMGA
jgi:hypothetical protein